PYPRFSSRANPPLVLLTPRPGGASPSPMNRALVSIHGIGRIEPDFWIAQRLAVGRHLPALPHLSPVWWGDLMDAGARLPAARDHLLRRARAVAQRLGSRPMPRASRVLHDLSNGLHNNVNGVAGVFAYLLPNRRR